MGLELSSHSTHCLGSLIHSHIPVQSVPPPRSSPPLLTQPLLTTASSTRQNKSLRTPNRPCSFISHPSSLSVLLPAHGVSILTHSPNSHSSFKTPLSYPLFSLW
jgi:hypothetical protein